MSDEIKDMMFITSKIQGKYQKALSELNYLLDMWSENFYTSKHQIYADKIENWFNAHDNIKACEFNYEIMSKLNLFDFRKYNMIKLRFQKEMN